MSKLTIFTVILTFAINLNAKCIGNPSVHDDFCDGEDKDSCKMHTVCEWKEENTIKVEIVPSEKKCKVKDSMQVHSHLCNGSDYNTCKTHSSFCEWK